MIILARQSVVSRAVPGGGEGERQSINLQDIKLSPNCIICYNFCYKLKQTADGWGAAILANLNRLIFQYSNNQ